MTTRRARALLGTAAAVASACVPTHVDESRCVSTDSLTACGDVTGRVVDAAGRPIVAAYVRVPRALDAGVSAASAGWPQHITDADGRYRLRVALDRHPIAAGADTLAVWIVAYRIDTLPGGAQVAGPTDSVALTLRLAPTGAAPWVTSAPAIVLPAR